eukprot:s5207_g1.t1
MPWPQRRFRHAAEQLQDEDVRGLPEDQDFEEVDLSRNSFSIYGFLSITKFCRAQSQLRILKLFKCGLCDQAAHLVSLVVLENPHYLEEVHLSHNVLTEIGAVSIIRAAERNRVRGNEPLWLRLERNHIKNADEVLSELEKTSHICGFYPKKGCRARHCPARNIIHLPYFTNQRDSKSLDVEQDPALDPFDISFRFNSWRRHSEHDDRAPEGIHDDDGDDENAGFPGWPRRKPRDTSREHPEHRWHRRERAAPEPHRFRQSPDVRVPRVHAPEAWRRALHDEGYEGYEDYDGYEEGEEGEYEENEGDEGVDEPRKYGRMASGAHWSSREVRRARLNCESESEGESDSAPETADFQGRSRASRARGELNGARRASPSLEREQRERSRSRALPLDPRELLLWEEQLMARQRRLDEMERQYRGRGRKHKRKRFAVP